MILVATILQVTGIGPVKAQDPHLGLTEYELSCMPCHGIDGRGDGPRAKSLKTAPADLTKIAKSNNGIFPSKKLTEIIDGRAIVGAHGQREMPVWGDRYRVRTESHEQSAEIDRRARKQIEALVGYLKIIQAK
jgi:mono/diheme cytochrome c family protein